MDFPLTVNSVGLMHVMLHFVELVLMYYASYCICLLLQYVAALETYYTRI